MSKIENQRRSTLIVDDEIPLLNLLADVLEDAGFEVSTFERGAAALAALEARRYDLLLVDVGLPDMNGMHICEVARARYGDDVAILIITADNRRERCITALELGADDFVGKPFDVEELLARVNATLRRTAPAPA